MRQYMIPQITGSLSPTWETQCGVLVPISICLSSQPLQAFGNKLVLKSVSYFTLSSWQQKYKHEQSFNVPVNCNLFVNYRRHVKPVLKIKQPRWLKVEIDRAYDIKNSFLFRNPIAKSFCIMFSVHFVIFFIGFSLLWTLPFKWNISS